MRITPHQSDRVATVVFSAAGWISVLVLLGIFAMLLYNGARIFSSVRPDAFLFGTAWNPAAYEVPRFGILPLLVSTLLVTFGAMAVAIPLGIGTAAYLAEFAPLGVYRFVRPVIELFAGVPSVAIGFAGITLVAPSIARIFGLNNGLNAMNGAFLLALMALPTIIIVAEESIRGVPQAFREASYALGASRQSTLWRVTLPAAMSGILTAVMLGLGRALGETMTVLMATGNAAAFPGSFFDPVRTITAAIAIELGETAQGTTHYFALFALGAVLFIMSLSVNIVSEKVARRFRYKI
ncbi:MAG: phosphate ABC transporter permease subunit PstC [Lewinellaceae bacterium]|jgi:phosphate transport system permease protein|nr:phosphate ABC transporter permease subunit PstC [Lewinellaceae bacterium]